MSDRIPAVQCHLFGEANHHGHDYRRGDEAAHCPGRHDPGKRYVSARSSRRARMRARAKGDR